MKRSFISTTGSRWVGLLLFLGITALAAAIGAIASANAADFYTILVKPAWAPSPNVFGPVWTVLYILMAAAAWLVWLKAGPGAAKKALMLYLAQLALNALWTWLFFRWRLGGLAFMEILLLWFVLLITLVSFWRIRVIAGILLLPYLLWVSFAATLMARIWRLNQGLL